MTDYRRRALRILPWVCAKCGREFSGKKLHRLTVHHKDHDHRNNPRDGSNWELLCIYCHDDEHSRREVADAYGKAPPRKRRPASTYRPFADLGDLVATTKDQEARERDVEEGEGEGEGDGEEQQRQESRNDKTRQDEKER